MHLQSLNVRKQILCIFLHDNNLSWILNLKVILYLESFIEAGYIHFWSASDILRLRPLKCEEIFVCVCVTSFDHSLRNIQLHVYMVGWLAFGGHCFVFYDGVHTLQISKIVLDPSCDEALLLLNEIINFTVFTVQDCIFSLVKLYVMLCTWIFRFE